MKSLRSMDDCFSSKGKALLSIFQLLTSLDIVKVVSVPSLQRNSPPIQPFPPDTFLLLVDLLKLRKQPKVKSLSSAGCTAGGQRYGKKRGIMGDIAVSPDLLCSSSTPPPPSPHLPRSSRIESYKRERQQQQLLFHASRDTVD